VGIFRFFASQKKGLDKQSRLCYFEDTAKKRAKKMGIPGGFFTRRWRRYLLLPGAAVALPSMAVPP
jgi:hypothetical protein